MSTTTSFDHALIRRLQRQSDVALKAQLLHTNTIFTESFSPNDNLDEERRRKESVASALSELQSLVTAEQANVSKLNSQLDIHNSSTSPTLTPAKRNIIHEDAVRTAYDITYRTITYLPPPSSPLNTLLAYRSTIKTINEIRQTIEHVRTRIAQTQTDLQQEQDAVKLSENLQRELQKRIDALENYNDGDIDDDGDGMSDHRKEQRKLREMSEKSQSFRKQSGALIRQLAKFSKDRLALMIAVEEMGGPVVGSELDVDKLNEMIDMNSASPQTKGKGKGKSQKVREKGQKRIDEIWGRGNRTAEEDIDNGDNRMDVDVVDPENAAGDEILNLIETLLNQSLDHSSSIYTVLPRDSAIARFLVRSYVATLHPRDALRIRLIDFAATVEEGG